MTAGKARNLNGGEDHGGEDETRNRQEMSGGGAWVPARSAEKADIAKLTTSINSIQTQLSNLAHRRRGLLYRNRLARYMHGHRVEAASYSMKLWMRQRTRRQGRAGASVFKKMPTRSPRNFKVTGCDEGIIKCENNPSMSMVVRRMPRSPRTRPNSPRQVCSSPDSVESDIAAPPPPLPHPPHRPHRPHRPRTAGSVQKVDLMPSYPRKTIGKEVHTFDLNTLSTFHTNKHRPSTAGRAELVIVSTQTVEEPAEQAKSKSQRLQSIRPVRELDAHEVPLRITRMGIVARVSGQERPSRPASADPRTSKGTRTPKIRSHRPLSGRRVQPRNNTTSRSSTRKALLHVVFPSTEQVRTKYSQFDRGW